MRIVVTMVSGESLAPGNTLRARAFCWRGTERDDTGPVTAFLSSSPAANAPVAIRCTCAAVGLDGKWDIEASAALLNATACAQHFAPGKPVYLHVASEHAHAVKALKLAVHG